MTELFALTILLSPPEMIPAEEAVSVGFAARRSAFELPYEISDSIEESLLGCVDQLETLVAGLGLSEHVLTEVVIGMSIGGNGGIILNKHLIDRFARTGIEVVIDIYCDDVDE